MFMRVNSKCAHQVCPPFGVPRQPVVKVLERRCTDDATRSLVT